MVYEEEVGAASPQISKTYAIEHTNVKPEPDVELKAVNDNFEENSYVQILLINRQTG